MKRFIFALALAWALISPAAAQQQPGAISVAPEGSFRPTYGWGITGNAAYATPTDLLTLCGAANKEIHPTRFEISGLATGAGMIDVVLIKRTVLNTGGTSVAQTPAKWRTISPSTVATPAASGTLNLYSVIPGALGAGVTIASAKLSLQLAASLAAPPLIWDFSRNNEQDLTLLGASECLAVNLNGDALPAGTALNFDIRWTEWGQ